MARFQFNLHRLLTPRAAQPVVAQHALRDLMAQDEKGAARGPGWFDSSFDLSHGLEVRDAGDGGYDDWLAARAIAERRAAARRSAVVAAAAAAATATLDDFSRFGIEGLALA